MEKTLQFSHQDLREKRTKAGKGNGKKDDQIKVENQKKKEFSHSLLTKETTMKN